MFMDRKTQYSQEVNIESIDSMQSKSESLLVICGYWKFYSKIYIKRQKIQHTQHNTEEQRTNLFRCKTYYKTIVIKTV